LSGAGAGPRCGVIDARDDGVERLLYLLDAADTSFDARAVLEREYRADGHAVVGAAEVTRSAARGRAGLPDHQAVADLARIASSPSEPRPVPDLDPVGAGGGGEQEERRREGVTEAGDGEGKRERRRWRGAGAGERGRRGGE